MPFFANKFSPKKIPPRKTESNIMIRELGPDFVSRELGLEIPPIRFTLSKKEISFEDGNWIIDSKTSGTHSNERMKKQLKALEEENNLLKIKFEMLFDMLVQTTAESQLKTKEIENLKQNKRNSQ